MTHSQDLRERVVAFVDGGGSKSEAARRFSISRWCVYDWMARVTLAPCRQGRTSFWKLDPEKLKAHVEAHPDAYQHERAQDLAVTTSGISYALKRLKVTRKKNATVSRKKRRLSHVVSSDVREHS